MLKEEEEEVGPRLRQGVEARPASMPRINWRSNSRSMSSSKRGGRLRKPSRCKGISRVDRRAGRECTMMCRSRIWVGMGEVVVVGEVEEGVASKNIRLRLDRRARRLQMHRLDRRMRESRGRTIVVGLEDEAGIGVGIILMLGENFFVPLSCLPLEQI